MAAQVSGYSGFVPRHLTELTTETIIGATRDVSDDKTYFSGKDHIQGYKGYVPKRIIKREHPVESHTDYVPSRPSSSEGRNAALEKLATSHGSFSPDSSRGSSRGSDHPESPSRPEVHGPRPISGYAGSLREITTAAGPRPATLGSSAIASSGTINIIAHEQETHVSPSTTNVHPLVGYTGYVPRRLNQDLAGKSMWRALDEKGAAPESPPPAHGRRAQSPTAQQARPASSEGASKPPPIAAIPGYSGFVPNRLRTIDGRFQVATSAIAAPAGEVVNHDTPATEYQRDLHVSGYTGYVPREYRDATGKSRWDAVTNNFREPGPNDVLQSRSVYSP